MSKRLGVPAHTLRYWEKQFPSAIKPTTGAGGRRYYRSETVDKLYVIKDLLYTHGMTIAGVKKMLRDGNLPDSANQISVENIQISAQPIPAQETQPKVNNADIDMAISFLESARSLLQ